MPQMFRATLGILLVVSAGFACSLFRTKSSLSWHILLEVNAEANELEAATKRTVSVIEQRLDAAGVQGSQVTQATPATGRILVNLPEVHDRQRLIELITAEGRLELTAVVSPPSPSPVQTFITREEAVASLNGKVPEDRNVLPYAERDALEPDRQPSNSRRATQWVIVERPPIVDGSELRNAAARKSGEHYLVTFSLRPEGADKFSIWTGSHINEYLGVVLNGEIKSIAFIKSQISDQGEISGRFTKQAAEDMALILRSGALPAPVAIIEQGNNK